MSDLTFASASQEAPASPQEFTENTAGAQESLAAHEPVTDADQATLAALGIADDFANLPENEQTNVRAVTEYIQAVIEQKGWSPTQGSFIKALDNLRQEMELDAQADPIKTLDRIGGVVRAWRDLSFIGEPAEKRVIFMKLARLGTSGEMHREVFKIMNDRKVWQ